MSNPSDALKNATAGAGLLMPDLSPAEGDGLQTGNGAAWLGELQALADRFGCAVSADLAAMNPAELCALHGFLKAKAEGE